MLYRLLVIKIERCVLTPGFLNWLSTAADIYSRIDMDDRNVFRRITKYEA